MYTETYEYALKRAEDTASVYMDAFARGSYDTPTKALVNMTVRQLSVWGGSTQLLACLLYTSGSGLHSLLRKW